MAMVTRTIRKQKWDAPGDLVEGHLVKMQKVKFKDGTNVRYFIKDKSGEIVFFTGTSQLNMMILRSDVGAKMQIVYKSDDTKNQKAGQSALKQFEVSVDERDKIDADPADLEKTTEITDDDIPF